LAVLKVDKKPEKIRCSLKRTGKLGWWKKAVRFDIKTGLNIDSENGRGRKYGTLIKRRSHN